MKIFIFFAALFIAAHNVSSEMIYKPVENYMLQFPLTKGKGKINCESRL